MYPRKRAREGQRCTGGCLKDEAWDKGLSDVAAVQWPTPLRGARGARPSKPTAPPHSPVLRYERSSGRILLPTAEPHLKKKEK